MPKLSGVRAGDVGVGQHQAVAREDHAGADPGDKAPRPGFERDLAHVDAHHGLKQPVEAGAHGRGRRHRRQQGREQQQRGPPDD